VRQITVVNLKTLGNLTWQANTAADSANSHRFVNGYQLEKQCQKSATIFQIYKHPPVFVNNFTRKSLFQKGLRKN
jgi:hypothetical protein